MDRRPTWCRQCAEQKMAPWLGLKRWPGPHGGCIVLVIIVHSAQHSTFRHKLSSCNFASNQTAPISNQVLQVVIEHIQDESEYLQHSRRKLMNIRLKADYDHLYFICPSPCMTASYTFKTLYSGQYMNTCMCPTHSEPAGANTPLMPS